MNIVQKPSHTLQSPDRESIFPVQIITSGNYKVKDGSQINVMQGEYFVKDCAVQIKYGRQNTENL